MKFFSALASLAMAAVAYGQRSIVETAIATPELAELVKVLTTPGYEPILEALSGPGPFTVFAPVNEAFLALDLDLDEVELISNVLLYHVVSGNIRSGDLGPLQFPETLMANPDFVNTGGEGARFQVTADASGVQLGWGITEAATANVVIADVVCTNGIVHVVDTVITPFPEDVVTIAVDAGLSTLVEQVVKADLVEVVRDTESLTIFAPTNEAFAAVPGLPDLTPEEVAAVLAYHVVPAVAYSTGLTDNQRVPTLNGAELTINLRDGGVIVNGNSNVALANVLTQNGVVHVIDSVLLPPAIEAKLNRMNARRNDRTIVEAALATPALSTLATVLQLPGYEPILNALNSPGTYTVFAPTNDAFEEAGVDPSDVETVSQVLYYHVLGATVPSGALAPLQFPQTLMTDRNFALMPEGQGQRVSVAADAGRVALNWGIPGVANSTANVVIADVDCSNGVVHVVDRVITPFPEDIVATATAAGLNTLIAQVVRAGLAEAVLTTPGITVFAPTDEAFAAIPGLPDLDLDTLASILLYHVVPAPAYSPELSAGAVPTLNGNTVDVTLNGGGVQVNGANVVVANALVQNGVVHVIDRVLLPPSQRL